MTRGAENLPSIEAPATSTQASDAFVQSRTLTPLERVPALMLAVPVGAGTGIVGGMLGFSLAGTAEISAIALGAKIGAVLGYPLGPLGLIVGTTIGAAVAGISGGRSAYNQIVSTIRG